MDNELFKTLENRIEGLVRSYSSSKAEIAALREENQRLLREREAFRERIDAILMKMEGIEGL
jgi:FtsZ-binding cell division protein ZapB